MTLYVNETSTNGLGHAENYAFLNQYRYNNSHLNIPACGRIPKIIFSLFFFDCKIAHLVSKHITYLELLRWRVLRLGLFLIFSSSSAIKKKKRSQTRWVALEKHLIICIFVSFFVSLLKFSELWLLSLSHNPECLLTVLLHSRCERSLSLFPEENSPVIGRELLRVNISCMCKFFSPYFTSLFCVFAAKRCGSIRTKIYVI